MSAEKKPKLVKEERVTSFDDFRSPHEASEDRLIDALDRAYHRPGLMIWRSFLQGFMAGVGASLGTVLFFVVSVYLLNLLGGVNLIKPLVDKYQQAIQAEVNKQIVVPNANTSANINK